MLFNEYYDVTTESLDEYGAFNISLDCDTPLYIDPILIFLSKSKEIKNWHSKIINYILFLSQQKHKYGFSKGILNNFFTFKEVRNNWLGVCTTGNSGLALGKMYANSLFENVDNILTTHNITEGKHLEKLCLFQEGIGKDKISDFVTNILLGSFAKYTEQYARKYIHSSKCKKFRIDQAEIDFQKELFVPQEYYLPYVTDSKGNLEFVLLTPKEILRQDEYAINNSHFYQSYNAILPTIDNETLRYNFENHVTKAINELRSKYKEDENPPRKEIERVKKCAISSFVHANPIIYDYYIRLQEERGSDIVTSSLSEMNAIQTDFYEKAKVLASGFVCETIPENSLDEALMRVNFFKREIEHNGLWRVLNRNGKKFTEKEIQYLFRLTWCNTKYIFNSEVNNGNGPVDFQICLPRDLTLVEFKLASNSKLSHFFKQIEDYKKTNNTRKAICVIFYFSEEEEEKVNRILLEYKGNIKVITIDCRQDNKKSASLL